MRRILKILKQAQEHFRSKMYRRNLIKECQEKRVGLHTKCLMSCWATICKLCGICFTRQKTVTQLLPPLRYTVPQSIQKPNQYYPHGAQSFLLPISKFKIIYNPFPIMIATPFPLYKINKCTSLLLIQTQPLSFTIFHLGSLSRNWVSIPKSLAHPFS